MELTIYADILFGFNFLMNLLILFLTTQLSRVPIRPVRLSIVSFLLSIYAVVWFVPEYSFFSYVWIKLFSIIISIYML
ncbi:MAG: sigma-E processing peptidase SpoIIGA, partial [Clostridia bacterium]|nr:sigma-E processing peptidase SpoIIGA [Clostridia bacterium]